jgi:hypothetical protein
MKIDLKLPQTASTVSAAASAAPGDGVVDSGVGGGAAAPAPPTARQAARWGAASSRAPAHRPHRGTTVGGETSPEELLSWNKGNRRRHGRFRRTTQSAVPKPKDRFRQCVEEIEPTLISQMHTIFSQYRLECSQFLSGCGGDVTNAP